MTKINLSVLCFVALSFFTLGVAADYYDDLKHNYYYKTCPQAEAIIADMMKDIVSKDVTVPARLIRMHFHDCFVRGCDASILINSTPDNKAERDAPPNNPSLQGYEVIDTLKQALEYHCPGIVSCADILTFATRESVFLSGKFPHYDVRGGRKDGKISRAVEVQQNLPPPFFEAKALVQNFAAKGLSLEEMVTLSGGHSIGVSHCSSIFGREKNFNNTGRPDPTLDPSLAGTLRGECRSASANNDPIVLMDRFSPGTLDNKYYKGILLNRGLFTSDQTLLSDHLTRHEVIANAAHSSVWEYKFVNAMIKMGEIEVKTGNQGEVRKICSRINHY